ncbi:MAG: TetR/AcrR family transcriptional regulator [Kiloniellales bacterium]
MAKTPQASYPQASRSETSRNERRRQNNRREELLVEAARLIAEKGYDGTSMRDIAAAVGMLPGSLYYHFPSKEELFVELHAQAVTSINQAVDRAIARESEPWARLEAAVAAHLESMLETTDTIAIVSPDFPEDRSELNARLIEQRNTYEAKFTHLIDDLGLPKSVDRRMFRLMLLGAVNWSPIWYRPKGKAGPAEIARAFVNMLRDSCAP